MRTRWWDARPNDLNCISSLPQLVRAQMGRSATPGVTMVPIDVLVQRSGPCPASSGIVPLGDIGAGDAPFGHAVLADLVPDLASHIVIDAEVGEIGTLLLGHVVGVEQALVVRRVSLDGGVVDVLRHPVPAS